MSTVLIVDDSHASLKLLSEILENNGYKTSTADHARKAFDSLETFLPDIILLDLMMPDISGYQVLQTIIANDRTSDIPVIIISARTERMDIQKAFDLGAVDYITKPIVIKELLEKVEGALVE